MCRKLMVSISGYELATGQQDWYLSPHEYKNQTQKTIQGHTTQNCMEVRT